MSGPRWLPRAFAALLLVVGGCGEDGTSLLIEITSSLTVPDEVDRLELTVVGDESGAMLDRSFALDGEWPQSVTVLPASDPNEAVTIRVRALLGDDPGGRVVERTVSDRFVEGQHRTVRVELSRECMFVECADGYTCEDGNCVSVVPDDGGVMDAATDAPGDAAADAGCTTGEECDDGVDCTFDSCEGGACVHSPDDSLCEPGTTCDPTAGCPARPCGDDAECDDARPCNGPETCSGGSCARGSPPTATTGSTARPTAATTPRAAAST